MIGSSWINSFILVFLLSGCSSDPTDIEIKNKIINRISPYADADIFLIKDFKKTNIYKKDSKTYIADIEYELYFKKSFKEVAEGNKSTIPFILRRISYMKRKYGGFKSGYRVKKKNNIILIRNENGWKIDREGFFGKRYISSDSEYDFHKNLNMISYIDKELEKKLGVEKKYLIERKNSLKRIKELIMLEGVNTLTEYDRTFLFHVCSRPSSPYTIELVKFLIKNGVTINSAEVMNVAPLQEAIKYNSIEIVKILVENGARVDSQDNFGREPIQLAKSLGYIDILNYLLKKKNHKSIKKF